MTKKKKNTPRWNSDEVQIGLTLRQQTMLSRLAHGAVSRATIRWVVQLIMAAKNKA